MANHRAPRHSASRTGTTDGAPVAPAVPVAAPATVAGKRRAVKPSRVARTRTRQDQTPQLSPVVPVVPAARAARVTPRPSTARAAQRTNPFSLLPSAPTVVGAAALVIAAAGAVTVTQPTDEVAAAASVPAKSYTPASALTGVSAATSSLELDSRQQAVSRDSERAALADATDEKLQEAVEAQAEERNAALAQLAASAEKYAGEIAANAWRLPLAGYRLTARFGYSSSLWSTTHTGLDFAAPSGTPVVAVANGVITSASYDGSYGNKIVLQLEDGTEVWYAHLTGFNVGVGESVVGGQQIGTVGSTGNSTGPHLHLEVRPGAGDPVDPYAALLARGLAP